MKNRTRGLVATCTVGLVLAVATPATAQTIDEVSNNPFEYSYDNYCDFGTEATSDDITIITNAEGTESYKLKATPSGRLFFQGHYYEHATYTNPDTGRSWTSNLKAYEHDIKILNVDEATNTATVLTSRHDHRTVFDEQGEVAGRTSNLSQFTLLVDLDTLDVELGEFLKDNGRSGDFCSDAKRLTVD